MYSDLATYVRERRQQLGLSQEELAERVGETYSQGDVSRLERGLIDVPHLATMASLAAALDVPVGNLLIAAGWFDDGHLVTVASLAGDDDKNTLEVVLAAIEAEFDGIRDLERQSEYRARRLRKLVRDLKATSGLPETLAAAD